MQIIKSRLDKPGGGGFKVLGHSSGAGVYLWNRGVHLYESARRVCHVSYRRACNRVFR